MGPFNKPMAANSWTRFNKYIYKYWKLQAMVIGLGLAATPLALVNPYLTKLIIDRAYGNRDLKLFLILAIIGGAFFVAEGLISSVSSYLSRRINMYVQLDMTKDLFRHLQGLPLSFYNNHSTGEYIYRINSDVRAVSDFVCGIVPQALTFIPRLVFILVIVFCLNWKLALFAALLVPITYCHPYIFMKRLQNLTRAGIMKMQGIFKELQEVFSRARLVKAFGREDYEIKKFEANQQGRIDVDIKNAKLSQMINFSSAVLNKTLSGIVALYGGYLVIKGQMTLGGLTAVMLYLTQLIGVLRSVGDIYQNVSVSAVTRHRLEEILDIKPGILDGEDALDYQIEKGSIEFKNINFVYKKNIPVLKDLSFSIPAGRHAVLVGLSGAGKTTIFSLILRLYETEGGSILIDGIDTRKIRLNALKSRIGIALQEPFLWNDTVANNILYGADNASRQDMIEAARLAEAHDFIMGFANGYDALVGEMACKISEGQKQRLALARALIKRPKILLMDEAMSSLDSETEDKIIDNIRRGNNAVTILMISHRLSAARKMDYVYFLESGSRIHAGTHSELLSKNQRYRELFASQLS